jgi:hypothetical protein
MDPAIALVLITLTGPDGQHVEINPAEIISIREPRGTDHFAKGTHCLITTTDGKYATVLETCERVIELIGASK